MLHSRFPIVDVSRQGVSHTCCKCMPTLPVFLFRTLGTIARHGRVASSSCTSVSQAGLLACLPPFSYVPCSELCVQCCSAARARTPVWHLPAESSVSSLAMPPGKAGWQAPYLPRLLESVVYFRSCRLQTLLVLSPKMRGKPCAFARFRSWKIREWLEALNLT